MDGEQVIRLALAAKPSDSQVFLVIPGGFAGSAADQLVELRGSSTHRSRSL
jgi:hypothetical protein